MTVFDEANVIGIVALALVFLLMASNLAGLYYQAYPANYEQQSNNPLKEDK